MYPLTSITWPYRGLKCWPIEVKYFLKLSADNYQFQMIAGYFFQWLIRNILCLWHYGLALLRSWFQTNPGRENSASFLKIQARKTFSYHGNALVTLYVQFLYSDWSKTDKWVHTEICAASWKLFTLRAKAFSTGCKKWNTAAIKSLLLSMAGLFIGFLVEKCVACQNSVIRFRMASFSFFSLLDA